MRPMNLVGRVSVCGKTQRASGSPGRHGRSSAQTQAQVFVTETEDSMVKRGAWVILAAAVLVLFTPRAGSAGIGEWIWEMSGPSMLGATSGCSVSLKKTLHRCSIFGFPVPLRSPVGPQADTPEAAIETVPPGLGKVWLGLGGGTYVSLW